MKGGISNKIIRTFLLLLVLFFILGVSHEDSKNEPGCVYKPYEYEAQSFNKLLDASDEDRLATMNNRMSNNPDTSYNDVIYGIKSVGVPYSGTYTNPAGDVFSANNNGFGILTYSEIINGDIYVKKVPSGGAVVPRTS